MSPLPVLSGIGAFQLVCLFVIGGMIAANLIFLIVMRRVNPVALFTSRGGVARAMDIMFTMGILVFFGRVLLHAVALPDVLLPSPLGLSLFQRPFGRAVGVVLVALAVGLFFAAYRQLGVAWRVGIDEQNPGALITSGVFRVTRNPIYLAADLYVVGTFLINGTVVFLLYATLAPAFLHLQILFEERALGRIHGAAYVEYCRRTGRYYGVSRSSRSAGRPG